MSIVRALTDRHDVTVDRERERLGIREPSPVDLSVTNTLLAQLLHALAPNTSTPEDIVFVDSTFQPQAIIEPTPGFRRRVLNRTPLPPENLTVTTGGVILYQMNVNRFGGTIVVTGSNPITLVLGVDITTLGGSPNVLTSSYGSVFLSANGGSWDFRLSDALWCGSVWAFATTGPTSIVGAEI